MTNETDPAKNIETGAHQQQGNAAAPRAEAATVRHENHNPHLGGHTGNSNQGSKHWLEYLTASFAFVAALGSVSAVVVGYWQWDSMNGQLDVMRDDKRPWLRPNIDVKELRLSDWAGDKHIFARLVFELKNHGESPATNINISTSVSPHPGNNRHDILNADQKVMCQQAKTSAIANPIGGQTVFPGESSKIESGSGISPTFSTGGLNRRFWGVAEARKRVGSKGRVLESSVV
jgi:hypothetical protein